MSSSKTIQSPIGWLKITATEKGLQSIEFFRHDDPKENLTNIHADGEPREKKKEFAHIEQTERELAEYFEGKRKHFDVNLDIAIGTEFQRQVWDALIDIPFGETRSYKEVAEAVGRPKACRAVGGANNLNPLPIVVPCHRVIGSDGKMVGYAHGLGAKEALLRIEQGSHESS